MRKRFGLVSALLGAGGIALLILGLAIGIGAFGVTGVVLMLFSITTGLVATAVGSETDAQDHTSWTYRPEEGLQPPTNDKPQLPMGGYNSGQR